MKVRSFLLSSFFFMLLLVVANPADAQCAMCTKAAADGIRNGQTVTAGINTGILYLLATPYLIVMTIGIVWYLNRRRRLREDAELGI